jgi:hypothetical protein
MQQVTRIYECQLAAPWERSCNFGPRNLQFFGRTRLPIQRIPPPKLNLVQDDNHSEDKYLFLRQSITNTMDGELTAM